MFRPIILPFLLGGLALAQEPAPQLVRLLATITQSGLQVECNRAKGRSHGRCRRIHFARYKAKLKVPLAFTSS